MRAGLIGFGSAVALIATMTLSLSAQAAPYGIGPPTTSAVETVGVTKIAGGYYGRYRNRGAQVRGYRRRAGGYSYKASDTINTYGNSRSRYGSTNSYRDPSLDRQTLGGPFDHGWFFDSGNARNGGNSPYMN